MTTKISVDGEQVPAEIDEIEADVIDDEDTGTEREDISLDESSDDVESDEEN